MENVWECGWSGHTGFAYGDLAFEEDTLMLVPESVHGGQHLAAEAFRIGAIAVETQELHCVVRVETLSSTFDDARSWFMSSTPLIL